jgi:uncharacterized membrane protein
MRYQNKILEICWAGLLCGLTILLPRIAYFKIGGSGVYLCAAVIFLYPLFLKFKLGFITTLTSVILVDLVTGYIAFTWITIVAYGGSIIIVYLFYYFNNWYFYFFGLLIAFGFSIFAYFFLSWIIIGEAKAINDLVATLIQSGVCFIVICVIYPMIKVLKKQNSIK